MKDLSSEMILAVDGLVPSFSVANDVAKGTYTHTHTHTHTRTYGCCARTRGHAQTLPLFGETVLIFLIGLLAFSEHPISLRAGKQVWPVRLLLGFSGSIYAPHSSSGEHCSYGVFLPEIST